MKAVLGLVFGLVIGAILVLAICKNQTTISTPAPVPAPSFSVVIEDGITVKKNLEGEIAAVMYGGEWITPKELKEKMMARFKIKD